MRSIIKKIILSLVALTSVILISGGFFIFIIIKDLPDPTIIENRRVAQSTKIYDRSGKILLYEIYNEEKRTIIPFSDIPDYVKKATLAIEDFNFYQHPAFDWRSIIRALLTNLVRGKIVQGGSTITQQLAKNTFLTPERTFSRKIKELLLAFQLERNYSKDEIFNLYLNQIPYGANAYGIEAASQTYFQKSAKDLTLAESALLAALPKAPSYYSPWGSHLKELLARKDYILDKMAEVGFISTKERDNAKKSKLVFAPQIIGIKAPHFVMAVQDYLNNKYGEDFVRTSGLKVITTLDVKLQEIAERVVAEGAKRNAELYQGTNAALIAEDATTGQILAMVGSRDYFDKQIDGNFNVAVQGLRQPGSAIKPFVYLTAFQRGLTPDTIVFDVPTEFDTTGDPEKSYKPDNFDEKFRGPIKLRDALAQSVNIPAVKTLYLAGIDNFLKNIKKFGISTLTERNRYGLSLVLGGGEIKMIELVGAYAALAQDGVKHRQTLILNITDAKGNEIESYQDQSEQVADTQYVRLINDILSDPEARAPLFQNSFNLTVFDDHQVALKTGTSNDYRDAWTFGYTPSLVVGVWAGNNNNEPMQKHGSSILAAVPIWSAFMKEVLADRQPETFPKPEPIITDKPVLKGEYPEIHTILYYVDKRNPAGDPPRHPELDPQFTNWEEPVLEWARNNPEEAEKLTQTSLVLTSFNPISINIFSPFNGAFTQNNQIYFDAEINSSAAITRIEISLNNIIIASYIPYSGNSYRYRAILTLPNLKLQNILKIVAWDKANNRTEKSLIIYSNQ